MYVRVNIVYSISASTVRINDTVYNTVYVYKAPIREYASGYEYLTYADVQLSRGGTLRYNNTTHLS